MGLLVDWLQRHRPDYRDVVSSTEAELLDAVAARLIAELPGRRVPRPAPTAPPAGEQLLRPRARSVRRILNREGELP